MLCRKQFTYEIIGHYMKCGQRYMQIYAAERWGIESFLLAANAA